jgi:hypothetical protein
VFGETRDSELLGGGPLGGHEVGGDAASTNFSKTCAARALQRPTSVRA